MSATPALLQTLFDAAILDLRRTMAEKGLGLLDIEELTCLIKVRVAPPAELRGPTGFSVKIACSGREIADYEGQAWGPPGSLPGTCVGMEDV